MDLVPSISNAVNYYYRRISNKKANPVNRFEYKIIKISSNILRPFKELPSILLGRKKCDPFIHPPTELHLPLECRLRLAEHLPISRLDVPVQRNARNRSPLPRQVLWPAAVVP